MGPMYPLGVARRAPQGESRRAVFRGGGNIITTVRVGGLKLKSDGEVLLEHLGIIHRLGLLAKRSLASKRASGIRV